MRIAINLVVCGSTAAEAETVQCRLNAGMLSIQDPKAFRRNWDNAQLNKACSPTTKRALGPIREAHVHLPASVIRVQLGLTHIETASDLEKTRYDI
jgi:hypothetical protein